MREFRSGSQILFGYLPDQTVDLSGRVWKVSHWNRPIPQAVDDTSLREELIRQASAWERTARDGGFVQDLRRGMTLTVYALNYDAGVKVEPFPQVWICRRCSRIETSNERDCRCGPRHWGQLPFVGYHDCGVIRQPSFPRCPTHGQARIRLPGTSSAAEIVVDCPECGRVLRRGLGMPNCSCGGGRIIFTVHRAARVYTPRTIVVVNPPTPERIRELREAGGGTRALCWVVSGMQTASVRQLGRTRSVFVRQLTEQGFDLASAEQLANQAVEMGQITTDDDAPPNLPDPSRAEAEAEAVRIALATIESRAQLSDLVGSAAGRPELETLYHEHYPRAFERAGLQAVELVDRFPVLRGVFGYTRGDAAPGVSRLTAFRVRGGQNVVYGDLAQTEALFFRLNSTRVARWLERRGHVLANWQDPVTARWSILRAAMIPPPGSDPPEVTTVGSDLLTLIHSYAHRVIRHAAVHAGLDRASLSEFLVPLHLGFFAFAAARGGFVLGGMQALFETSLHELLDETTFSEHRCALDPGCEAAGAACVACLHLGEPSCRWFNRYLDRRTLYGTQGFLQVD
jgi:voltage-gated potassium channel Kch